MDGVCKGDVYMALQTILNDTPEHLIQQYRQVLIRAGIPVEKIILFGSYAKGNPKPWSDIDVCIVSPMFGKDNYDETVRLMKLTSGVENMIEPHPYSPKDLDDPWDPLAYEIRTHGKVIAP